jgi:hypothetical protein
VVHDWTGEDMTATTDRETPAYPADVPARGAPGALLERPISLAPRSCVAPRVRAAASATIPFLRSFR